MFLKSPDPTAYAVTMGGRVYPVRDGVFLVDREVAPELTASFEPADNVREDLAQELVELGSSEAERVRETSARAEVDGAPGATVDLSPLHERIEAAHDRIGELEHRLAEHLATHTDEPKDAVADTAASDEPGEQPAGKSKAAKK